MSIETLPETERKTRVQWLTEDVFEDKMQSYNRYRPALDDHSLPKKHRVAKVAELKAKYKKAKNVSKTACRLARERQWAKENSDDMMARRIGNVFRRLGAFVRAKKSPTSGQISDADVRMLTTKKRNYGDGATTLVCCYTLNTRTLIARRI